MIKRIEDKLVKIKYFTFLFFIIVVLSCTNSSKNKGSINGKNISERLEQLDYDFVETSSETDVSDSIDWSDRNMNFSVLVFKKLISPTVQKIITEKTIIDGILNNFYDCEKYETSERPAPGTLFVVKDISGNFEFGYCHGYIGYKGKWYKVMDNKFMENMLSLYDNANANEEHFIVGQ